jgi:phage terminase small subunit
MGKLTPKQSKFVLEYLIDLNATQAAIRAGYSEKTAYSMGFQNLRKLEIQKALEVHQKEIAERAGVTIDDLIRAYKQIAFVDLAQCYDENGFLKNIHEIPESARAALAGIEIDEIYEGRGEDRVQIGCTKKVKLWDKLKALDALGRHLGFFNADTSQKPEIPAINLTLTKIDVKSN